MPHNPGTCTTCGGAILYRPDGRTECARCSGLGPLVHRGGELIDRGDTWPARAGGEVVHLETEPASDKTEHPELVEVARRELVGYELACYCGPDEPCHGDVWLEVLDPAESR